jgi:acyl-CoA synthetase (AMP-forming)/AMP-acid ligase II
VHVFVTGRGAGGPHPEATVSDAPDALVARFLDNVRRVPRRPAVVFSRSRGGAVVEDELTYADLHRRAYALGGWLAERYPAGERAMLMYPTGLDFIGAFLGSLYAGLVPVPVPVPEGHRQQIDRTGGIATDCRPAVVLTDSGHAAQTAAWLFQEGLEQVPAVATDALAEAMDGADAAGTPRVHRSVPPESLALLQYTSGSTSEPKGVMVTHANLAHNIRVGQALLGWDEGTTFCSWLPLYHDMGLISMLLVPLFLGGTAVIMPPTDFLKHPDAWLRLIHRHRAQASGAPNFGYELCLRRVTAAQIAALDLSHWRFACNGAEPIDAHTLRRFADRFEPAGFRPDALVAGYGLAEATLFVAGTRPGRRPTVAEVARPALERDRLVPAGPGELGQPLVSSGVAAGLEVRVVDPHSRVELPEGAVGEVWIRGASVTQGYWGREPADEPSFQGTTASGGTGFLRTGDLGGYLGGELYITGRIKELLIVHGRNLYPQDVEREVRELEHDFASLPCCAFSVPAPGEELVVVQEVRQRGTGPDQLAELARSIRGAVGGRLGVRVGGVALVRLGQVRRTTSGKLRRRLMRELFLGGDLLTVHEDLDPEVRRRYRGEVPEAPLAAAGSHPGWPR